MAHFLNGTAQITLTGTVWPSSFPGDHCGMLERILTASRLSDGSTPLITVTLLTVPSALTTNEQVTRPSIPMA